MTTHCFCIGGPVVSAGPKVLTWKCSRCGKLHRWPRRAVTLIDLHEVAP